MPLEHEAPGRAGDAEPGANVIRFDGTIDVQKFSPASARTQASIPASGRARRPHLRLISAPRPGPPAPVPTLWVTISASTGRYPYGRSMRFYLTPNQLNELLGHASRLEAGRGR
jgi:hypothetical protein